MVRIDHEEASTVGCARVSMPSMRNLAWPSRLGRTVEAPCVGQESGCWVRSRSGRRPLHLLTQLLEMVERRSRSGRLVMLWGVAA